MSDSQHEKRGVITILLTTLAAAFGVQSRKNHERDFSQSSIWPFVAAGVLFTAVFIMVLVLVARWALSA